VPPTLLADSFERAMKRDYARNQLPKSAVWTLSDFIPGLGAPLGKRGGWTNASANIAATKSTASQVRAGIYAPFAAAAKNCAIDEDGELYTIAANGTVTDVGAALCPIQNPIFHREKVIIPAPDGSTAPKYYDGSTLGNLAGSPPAGKYACVFKDRTVLGGTSANPQRSYFSPAGNPAGTWDTTNGWWDASYPLTGYASLRNMILLFSVGTLERLRGSIPPPGSDFVLDTLCQIGCTDARSIAMYGDYCIWANPGGLFITDGSSYDDLTVQCGVKHYWQDALSGYTSSWLLAGGIYRDYYLATVIDASGVVKLTGMIDLRAKTFLTLTNVDAAAYWRSTAVAEELYFGRRGAAYVGSLSSIFAPGAGNKNDGNGVAVIPYVELPYIEIKPGLKNWRDVWLTAHVTDAAADEPVLSVSYVTTPEATSYTALADTFAETAQMTRRKLAMGVTRAQGLGLKIAQTHASALTYIDSLESEIHPLEGQRVR
jgi:hypothetical protein